jgi:hypothetical protein
VEEVMLATDSDLDVFVRQLLHLFENPRDRTAIRSGWLRFTLQRSSGPASARGTRVERGAVTERVVREVAKAHGRLVLGPRAVLTPLARDLARQLDVSIEKDKQC